MSSKWDLFYLDEASRWAERSKDPSTKVGCVIVRPDMTMASQGYNGFARGMNDDEALYLDRDYKIANIVHAELNAILSSRETLTGYTLYVSGLPPCTQCAAAIIQKGIARVVTWHVDVPERWQQSIDWSMRNMRRVGIEVCQYRRKDGFVTDRDDKRIEAV